MTFGRYLLERGVLRREQLEEATEVMVLFGGRLGTILVEAGMLTLDQLEEHLARHLRVPRAPLERIGRPEREALAAVPAELARRRKILPLWVEKRRLHAAMLDPGNADQVEELAFASGLPVAPHVVAERRLAALLERHYGLRPDPRFTNGRFLELAAQAREGPPAAAPPPPASEGAGDPEGLERARWRERHGLAPLAEGEELCAESAFVASQTLGAAPGPGEKAAQLEIELVRASSRERVAPLVLQLAAIRAGVAALFAVRDAMIQGVLAIGAGAQREIEAIFVPTVAPSMLAGPARGEVFFGRPAREGLDAAILRALGRGEVREATVMPIAVAGRVVHLLYADNGAEPIAKASLAALGALCDQAGSTWSRLIAECTQRHC